MVGLTSSDHPYGLRRRPRWLQSSAHGIRIGCWRRGCAPGEFPRTFGVLAMQPCLWILAAVGRMRVGLASAQELGVSGMYGRGVHAYFSGQTRDGYNYLSSAIDRGSQDPPAFYFRGVAYQRL